MKITKQELYDIIQEELQATLEEQQQYTSAEKALFKKITGSGLGKTAVQKLLSVFKSKDIEYITPETRDKLFRLFADYSSGRNKPSGGRTLSPDEAKELDFYYLVTSSRDVPSEVRQETFDVLENFLKSGKFNIPNKSMPAGGTSRERFFEALKDAQSEQPEAFGTSESQLAAKARKAMEVLQDIQNLIVALSKSKNNLSVEDYAKFTAPAIEAIETVYGVTGLIGLALAESDEDEFVQTQEKMRQELKKQAEKMYNIAQAAEKADLDRMVKKAMTPMDADQRARVRVLDLGFTPGQQRTTEGKLKMKITKQQLINIIKEELAVISEQEDEKRKNITGSGQAQTASARFTKLRKAATQALEGDEITAQEREVLSLIEEFFFDLASMPGVDLSKKRSQIEPLLQRIQRLVAPGADKDTDPKTKPDTTNPNVPSLEDGS